MDAEEEEVSTFMLISNERYIILSYESFDAESTPSPGIPAEKVKAGHDKVDDDGGGGDETGDEMSEEGEYEGRDKYSIEVRSLKDNQLVAKFALPGFAPCHSVFNFYLCTSRISCPGKCGFAPLSFPFATPPFPQLMLLTFLLQGRAGTADEDIHFVMLTDPFYQSAEQAATYPNKEIPWEAWGPSNTRIFNYEEKIHIDAFMYKVYSEGCILDFNPIDISRDLCRGETDGIFTKESVFGPQFVFNGQVTSRLAYRRTKLNLEVNPNEHPILGDPLIFETRSGDVRVCL